MVLISPSKLPVNQFESPVVRKYASLVDPFLVQVAEQEEGLIAAGLPAAGLTEFLRDWMYSWNQDAHNPWNPNGTDSLMTDDLVFTASLSFGFLWNMDNSRFLINTHYKLFREVLFGPLNDTREALPYFDFDGDEARIALPWGIPLESRIARWIPRFLRVGPFRQTFLTTGMDRYVVRRVDGEWKMARIDSDWDFFQLLVQLLPIPTPSFDRPMLSPILPSRKTVRR